MMSIDATQEALSLANVCEDQLEEQFQKMYPAVLSQMKAGDAGSITIKLDFKRVEDTATMVKTSYSLTPKFPAIKKASVCQITGDGKLKTEKLPEKKATQLSVLEGGK